MKNGLHTLKQYFKVEGGKIGGGCAFLFLCGMIGIAFSGLIIFLGDAQEWQNIGGLLTAVVALTLQLVGGMMELPKKFNLAVSMGKTRKEFIFASYIYEIVRVALYLSVVDIISRLEVWYFEKRCPKMELDVVFHETIERPEVFPGIVLGLSILAILNGALFMRFGQKYYCTFWVLWMVIFNVGSRMLDQAVESPDTFLGRIGVLVLTVWMNAGKAGLVAIATVIGLVGVVLTVQLLRRQRVTL